MVNVLKSLIIEQLKSVFNGIKVYDEQVKQGLQVPAFFVFIVENSQRREQGRTVSREIEFNVIYVPETENIRNECDSILEAFQTNFRYVANKFHVHNIDANVSDDVLTITFSVKALLRETEQVTTMQDLRFGGVTSE